MTFVTAFPDLDEQDAFVFCAVFEQALLSDALSEVNLNAARNYPDLEGMTDEDYEQRLKTLAARDYISLAESDCSIPQHRFDQFIEQFVPNYEAVVDTVGQHLAMASGLPRPERWIASSPGMSSTLRLPLLVIDRVLRDLQSREMIVVQETEDEVRVMAVTMALRQQYRARGKSSTWYWL